jgi:hypothetical protein
MVPLTKHFLFTVLPKSDYTTGTITVFCNRIYRVGQRLSNFKLLCNLLGIIPVVGVLLVRYRPFSATVFTRILSLLSSLYISGVPPVMVL